MAFRCYLTKVATVKPYTEEKLEIGVLIGCGNADTAGDRKGKI
jgi:hypothetical protein